jgi:hypothetical protein
VERKILHKMNTAKSSVFPFFAILCIWSNKETNVKLLSHHKRENYACPAHL